MTAWVAISYGALDLRDWHDNRTSVEIMLLSTLPSEPIGLEGQVAELWRRLVYGPVADDEFVDDERELLQEFEAAGIASQDCNHPSRIRALPKPWFVSPLHELATALVASVARDHEIDVVVIKGPVLHRQGLRDRAHSGDVDVLVAHRRAHDLSEALSDWGWQARSAVWDGTEVFHSVTLRPPGWGCEIDLHRRFPGIGLEDDEAFAAVYACSESTEFAAVEGRVPDLATSSVLAALHVTRPSVGSPPSQQRIEAAARTLTLIGKDAVAAAVKLNATAALKPVLQTAFADEQFEVHEQPLNWVMHAQPNAARFYLVGLRAVPWRQRPRVLLRVVWPPQEVVRASGRRAGVAREGWLKARFSRIRRGVSAFFRRSPSPIP